jgi:hypothetical protein
MLRYLLVDEREGRVIGEAASPALAAQLRRRLETARGDAQISLVRLNHEQNRLSAVSSMVAMRPLSPLAPRSARKPG